MIADPHLQPGALGRHRHGPVALGHHGRQAAEPAWGETPLGHRFAAEDGLGDHPPVEHLAGRDPSVGQITGGSGSHLEVAGADHVAAVEVVAGHHDLSGGHCVERVLGPSGGSAHHRRGQRGEPRSDQPAGQAAPAVAPPRQR